MTPYWCAAQIDRRREKLALSYLALAGFQTYVPRIRGPRRTAVALFPSYTFIAIELQWHAARWAPGVWKLIMSGDEPARVPDRIVDELQEPRRPQRSHRAAGTGAWCVPVW